MATRGTALIFAVACLTALGCGARTDTLFDDGGGIGGLGVAGSDGAGGHYTAGSTGFGGSGATAGTGFGGVGAFPSGGYGAGGLSVSGSGNVGGFGAVSGTGVGGFGAAGGIGVGGFGAVGGIGVGGAGGGAGVSGAAGISGAGAGGTIVDGCVAASQTACNKCRCETCGTELNSCLSDLTSGCAQIVLCTQLTQCQGLGCYVACNSVITANGGLTGAAVTQALGLASCASSASASCGCD